MPSIGRIDLVSEPGGPGVRVDGTLFNGLEVSDFYDSMLSKLIVWGRDRDEARQRLRRALAEYELVGVKTTIPFHRWLVDNEDFAAGVIDTHFLERHAPPDADLNEDNAANALLAAALLSHARRRGDTVRPAARPTGNSWRTAARQDSSERQNGGRPWRGTF